MIFGINKMRKTASLANDLLASQEGLCYVEFCGVM
jgi:hypothetical protein